jgi:phosphopantetheine adenylyltransferase
MDFTQTAVRSPLDSGDPSTTILSEFLTEKERVEMLETATFKWDNVQIDVFDGLLMGTTRAKGG